MKPNIPSKLDLGGLKDTLLNFIVPLICLGVSGALGLLVIYPSFKSVNPLKEEISQQQTLKEQLDTKVTRLKDLQSYRTAVKENSDLINRVFVSEASAPLFLDEINQISVNSGFEVTRLATSSSEADTEAPLPAGQAQPAPTNEVKSLTAALGAKTTYEDLIRFMSDLEEASRVLDIKDFRYNYRAEVSEGSGGAVDISISGPYMLVESTAVTDEPIDLDVRSRGFQDLVTLLKKLKQYDFSGTFEPPAPVEEESPENSDQPAPNQPAEQPVLP